MERSPGDGDVLYYLALASVRGRRLKGLRVAEASKIGAYLAAAIQSTELKAHYFYLLVLLKEDFYRKNGFREVPPTTHELLRDAGELPSDNTEITKMMSHITVGDATLAQNLLRPVSL